MVAEMLMIGGTSKIVINLVVDQYQDKLKANNGNGNVRKGNSNREVS